ncbi:hypothetical protein ABZ848_42475, partial [Streptomyces sp. NPDC047081]|uniref:hypothetical protein n=1 Tax=Streptomyces sp. NPDC047081 TaxID=3154706 RepID=UPI0033C85AB2
VRQASQHTQIRHGVRHPHQRLGRRPSDPLADAETVTAGRQAAVAYGETVTGGPQGAVAYGETVTGGRHAAVSHGEGVPTAWGTTSLRPSDGRPARPGRLRWVLAGTAVLAAGTVGGLFLAGLPPFADGVKTTTVSQVVQSATGWQAVTGVSVRRGDQVAVRFVSGEWTAATANMPMTGPAGYDAETDKRLDGAKDCKIKKAAPFGALLAVLAGVKNPPVHTVGRGLTFKAAGSGTLQLGMNDTAGYCSQDNRGSLTVRVSVTHKG